MANDVMIEAQQLSKTFGSVRALDRVSFKVRKGEVVGFLGPNGAGKSTTMRILTCFISSSSGTAKVRGVDVFDDPLAVRESLGYLPQRAPLYGEMRVWDYLRFAAEMRGLDDSTFRSRMKQVVEVCGLAKMLGKDIRTLSHGYRQRVGLGQALIHNPPILILDEPTSDLDPNEKAEVIRYIKEIGKERTILLSTHNLAEVEAACARAIIVSKGRVVADGSLDEMRARTGQVRYVVTIDEKATLKGGEPPKADAVRDALATVEGLSKITELPTDESTHTFQMVGSHDADARADLFRLAVEKGWLLLEMRRETQTLEDVFMSLTRGDERADRGRALLNDDEADAAARAEEDEEEEDEDEDEDDESDDEDEEEDEDESEVVAKSAKASPAKSAPGKSSSAGAKAKAEEEEEDEEEDEDEEEESDDEDDEEEDEEEEEKPSDKSPQKRAKKD